jgi:amidase
VTKIGRRDFLRLGIAAAAAPKFLGIRAGAAQGHYAQPPGGSHLTDSEATAPATNLEEATIAGLQARMSAGTLTAEGLASAYLSRIDAIDRSGPRLNSIIELNPDAVAIARARDSERAHGHVRGPLHGIPILLKDNIDTADGMMTTAGSLALVGKAPSEDATVAARLRDAGAVIIGKTNLSEWANMRSTNAASGWSGRGGLTRNPYILNRNPSGSSSGSAAAVSANLVAAALGTETDGSIVSPANNCGVVGLKPTVGLTSRAGVIPISHSQDTVGVHARTVADAAAVLGALVGVDPRDEATSASAGKLHHDYTQFLDANGLAGARIGVARHGMTGFSSAADAVLGHAIAAMRDAGATVVDPADIPTIDKINRSFAEDLVLVYEFKRDLNAYLATRHGVPIHSLADAIAFNDAHHERELRWFGQEWFTLAESDRYTRRQYRAALARCRARGGKNGIDATLEQHNLDALIAPSGPLAWVTHLRKGDPSSGGTAAPAAIAGYPLISVPAGHRSGLPLGITFMGTAWSEPKLIRLASGFEAISRARRKPQFLSTLGSLKAGS